MASWLLALLCLAAPALSASAQEALSAPISGSVGDPVYSESSVTGPSTTLVPGGNNLTTPYQRSGISDPLSFLIESSNMNPLVTGSDVPVSYVDGYVPNGVLTDPTQALGFREYQDNRLLMSGAGSASTLRGRPAYGSSMVSRVSGVSATSAGLSGFDHSGMRASFAAGSSALAAAQTNASFLDPNSLVAAASVPGSAAAALAAAASPDASSADMPGANGTAMASSALASDASSGSMGSDVSSMMLGMTPATVPAIGPAPGQIFPDIAVAGPAAHGFPDSTLGTAGSQMEEDPSVLSPLSSVSSGAGGSPFTDLDPSTNHFLNPTLTTSYAAPLRTAIPSAEAVREYARKQRLHAMIYNPQGAAMVSPFTQRAMERDYQRKHSQRRTPTLETAPSIRPEGPG